MRYQKVLCPPRGTIMWLASPSVLFDLHSVSFCYLQGKRYQNQQIQATIKNCLLTQPRTKSIICEIFFRPKILMRSMTIKRAIETNLKPLQPACVRKQFISTEQVQKTHVPLKTSNILQNCEKLLAIRVSLRPSRGYDWSKSFQPQVFRAKCINWSQTNENCCLGKKLIPLENGTCSLGSFHNS